MSTSSNRDSGYAWLVLMSSVLCMMIVFGISWTVGLFYVIFLEEFGGSKEAVALVSSLNTATLFFAGKRSF